MSDLLHLPLDSAPAVLLRVPVGSPTWAESVPPLPEGAHVSVAFSSPDVEAEHGEALGLLGYSIAGAYGPGGGDEVPSADFLVQRLDLDRWPRWRDELLAGGGRVFDLAMGPARILLAPALAVHHR